MRQPNQGRGDNVFASMLCVCGGLGVFGYDSNLSAALRRDDLPSEKRRKLAGKWYCANHRPGAKNA
ncbi:MAG: hypothetical protein OIF58_08375 [Cohaesibacter sp.]|nr:hypothetical protein [Cohaesibacter sp.]MCV6575734.1 hypothetical protein [Cohaesibacter sp.]MCV6601269.1 hypothetical protein [Cohaesibacter sp.]